MVGLWFSSLVGMVVCKTSVVCWGESDLGGNCASTILDVGVGVVESIVSNNYAFAVIMNSGADVVCWGNSNYGGDCDSMAEEDRGVR